MRLHRLLRNGLNDLKLSSDTVAPDRPGDPRELAFVMQDGRVRVGQVAPLTHRDRRDAVACLVDDDRMPSGKSRLGGRQHHRRQLSGRYVSSRASEQSAEHGVLGSENHTKYSCLVTPVADTRR